MYCFYYVLVILWVGYCQYVGVCFVDLFWVFVQVVGDDDFVVLVYCFVDCVQ